jgi:hypothetical protein
MFLSRDTRLDNVSDANGIGFPGDPVSSVPLHPLGVKPLGNRYLSTVRDARECIGPVGALPDEVLTILLEYLDYESVRLLGYTCKFLLALCSSEELWKALFLE